MSIDIDSFQNKIREASPLEVPYLLMQLEQYDCESAQELLAQINLQFEKDGMIDNVVNPVMTTIVDSLLMLPVFKGFSRKLGLSANRVMAECASFNYDGKIIYLQPDSFVESSNQTAFNASWAEIHRADYDRSKYENPSVMGRYKKEHIKAAGSKKNLQDEYTDERNITARKDNPDHRRNDPKNDYNAETDHIIPLKRIFDQVQHNVALSDGDIKRIANSEENLAVTGRRINNPKRDMTNSEFIRQQDKLKAEGKPYVGLTKEQRDNMIRMERTAQSELEKGINSTVIKNLVGKGVADRNERKAAIAKKEKELGRKLTEQERTGIDKQLGREKAFGIHKENLKSAGNQTLMYAIGSAVLFLIKPIYYEMKDSFLNGFIEGVGADSYKKAFSLRFGRVRDYVMEQMSDFNHLFSSAADMIKNLISSVIEGLIGMFVGIFKKAFRLIKECLKIFTQSYDILFGRASESYTAAEKGDAIVKIIGASATALCGIWIDSMLEQLQFIPDGFRGVISTLVSGLASMLVFYLLDKADLFNVKAERRNARVKEIFDERIADIRKVTRTMNETVIKKLREQAIESRQILARFSSAFNAGDYTTANKETLAYASFLKIDMGYESMTDFSSLQTKGALNWEM